MCKSEKKGKQTCINCLKLTIVSLLYHTMALCTAYYLDNGGDHRVSLIKLTISVSCRINMICILFKIKALLIMTLFARLNASAVASNEMSSSLHYEGSFEHTKLV